MNLVSKIQRYYLFISPIIALAGTFILYFTVNYFIYENVDERIEFQKKEIIEQIQIGKIPQFKNFIEVEKLDNKETLIKAFKDTLIYESTEEEEVPYRQLIFSRLINGVNYKILIRQAIGEAAQLINSLFQGVLILMLFIIFGVYLTNHFVNKKIWNELYKILENLRTYELFRPGKFHTTKSTIEEFRELNNSILEMTKKIENDYLSLKEFTENASHEIQTPVSVIKFEIESLLQSKELTESEMTKIIKINNSATKLSRLMQSLLLLTKLENMQFDILDEVDLKTVIIKQISEFDDIIAQRDISITADYKSFSPLAMNFSLAEILIMNLIKNAILYCGLNGKIDILLNSEYLKISNSGAPLKETPGRLFDRFVKESSFPTSLGLGLSIVKQICTLHNFKIEYQYEDKLHVFTITF